MKKAPCATRELTAADGARVRFCAHGGHVLGWSPAGGTDRLWLSRDTGCAPGVAIRGGVPVVWPQFAGRGDGPRHGVVRDRAWTVLAAGTADDGVARARLERRADASTRASFPHVFTLTLDVAAVGSTLELTLTAVNDGLTPFAQTAALHTYLRVSSTEVARVRGLARLTAEHNDGTGSEVLDDAPLRVVGPVDLAVAGVTDLDEVVVEDPDLGDLVLTATGFDSRVVWNPGTAHAPGDVHAGGEREFVCVEPALLHPLTLQPGERWSGTQRLRAQAADG